MKSTWRKDRTKWGLSHWLLEKFRVLPTKLDQAAPVHSKSDSLPFLPQFTQHKWILFHAFIPMVFHQTCLWLGGYATLGRLPAFMIYFTAFNFSIVREMHFLRGLAYLYGFFDGDVHDRDGVPDHGVGRVTASLFKLTGARMSLAIYLAYRPEEPPIAALASTRWWLWVTLASGLYGIVLDFWFYWYHRCMHDIGPLWRFHRIHHMTKHPNQLLSAYADDEQEFLDMVGVPILTYFTFYALGIPLGFYDWWICHQYVIYTEVFGHSGIRVHVTAPSTLSWLLHLFDAELAVEDHDLHHRKGWRKSYNYGKQTRVWDRVFGTCHDRIESIPANIDYTNQGVVPLF